MLMASNLDHCTDAETRRSSFSPPLSPSPCGPVLSPAATIITAERPSVMQSGIRMFARLISSSSPRDTPQRQNSNDNAQDNDTKHPGHSFGQPSKSSPQGPSCCSVPHTRQGRRSSSKVQTERVQEGMSSIALPVGVPKLTDGNQLKNPSVCQVEITAIPAIDADAESSYSFRCLPAAPAGCPSLGWVPMPASHRCSWCMTCPRPAGLPLLELETSSVKLTTATNNYLTPIAGPKLQVSTQQHSIEAALTAELAKEREMLIRVRQSLASERAKYEQERKYNNSTRRTLETQLCEVRRCLSNEVTERRILQSKVKMLERSVNHYQRNSQTENSYTRDA